MHKPLVFGGTRAERCQQLSHSFAESTEENKAGEELTAQCHTDCSLKQTE